jgi:hypothetical protein
MNCRLLFAACVVAIAVNAAESAKAVVVPFDISPDVPVVPGGVIPGGTFIGSPFTYYNIQFDVNGGGVDLNIRTARAIDAGGPGVDQVVSDGLNGSAIVTKGPNFYLNTPFASGDIIGDGVNETSRGADNFNVINDGGFQMYVPGDNFLGFQLTNGNYGYVHVSYDPAGSTYTFTGGAYENTGASLAAGAVPEPASIVLLAAAGICAVGARRAGRRRSSSRWPQLIFNPARLVSPL